MKKIIPLLLFLCAIYAGHKSGHETINPYFSPGFQVGLNSGGEFFVSAQFTIGIVSDDLYNDFYPIIGLTLGKRFYYNKNESNWDSYKYTDIQVSALTLGFGYGIITKEEKRYNKFKIFGGAWGLLSYDYINWDKKQHHYGIFAVLPIRYEGGDFNID